MTISLSIAHHELSAVKLICSAMKHRIGSDLQGVPLVCMAVGLSIVHILLLCAHRTMGGAHFGNRYIVDILPAVYTAFTVICMNLKRNTAADKQRFEYMVFSVSYITGLLINFAGVLQFYNH